MSAKQVVFFLSHKMNLNHAMEIFEPGLVYEHCHCRSRPTSLADHTSASCESVWTRFDRKLQMSCISSLCLRRVIILHSISTTTTTTTTTSGWSINLGAQELWQKFGAIVSWRGPSHRARTIKGCVGPGNVRQQFLGAQERRSPCSPLL